MKFCRICLYLSKELNKNLEYTNRIKKLIENLDINAEFVYNDDYTKIPCNLLIYDLSIFGTNIKQFENKTFFTNSKSSKTYFLCIQFEEPHSYPFQHYNEMSYTNVLYKCLYPESNRSYSISNFDNSEYNFYKMHGIYDMYTCYLYYKNGAYNHKIKKTKFCCQLTSHNTFMRTYYNYYFNDAYKKIDNYGLSYRPIENPNHYSDRLLQILLPRYKFYMCFENNFSFENEGYITEKIFKAYMNGSIPIYWGNNKQIYNILNKDSFINVTDLMIDDVIEIVKEYDNNDSLYNKMLYTYPFNKNFDPEYYLNKIENDEDKYIIKIIKLSINENTI